MSEILEVGHFVFEDGSGTIAAHDDEEFWGYQEVEDEAQFCKLIAGKGILHVIRANPHTWEASDDPDDDRILVERNLPEGGAPFGLLLQTVDDNGEASNYTEPVRYHIADVDHLF